MTLKMKNYLVRMKKYRGNLYKPMALKPLKIAQMQGARKAATFAATQVHEDCGRSGQRRRWVVLKGFV